MSSPSTGAPSVVRPSLGRVVRTGVTAALAAAVVTAVAAYVIGQVFAIDSAFQPMTPPAVAAVTILYTMAGTAVLAVVCRLAANPRRTFIQVALVGLALSFVPQVMLLATGMEVPLGEFTARNVLALSSLHFVAAAVALPIMLRIFRS